MDSARKIIFVTCILSGICYSNAEGGAEFFTETDGSVIKTPTENQILRKIAENLICGDTQGWVSHFWGLTHPDCQCNLKNPCGENCKCVVNDELTDYTCEAETGFIYNEDTGTCTPEPTPPSGVICKAGSRRVAADTLIVGKLDNYEWVSGIYVRKAGLGYENTDVEIYNPKTMMGATNIQRYLHDVPLKGREFYEQFKIDCKTKKMEIPKKVVATLSYNYEENHWQFKHVGPTDISATIDPKFTVSSRSACALCAPVCAEDVKIWMYTWITLDTSTPPITHYNVGRLFIESAADKFQIRDTAALPTSRLAPLKTAVDAFKCPVTTSSTTSTTTTTTIAATIYGG